MQRKTRVDFEEENDDWNNNVMSCPDKRTTPHFDEIRRCGETDAHNTRAGERTVNGQWNEDVDDSLSEEWIGTK